MHRELRAIVYSLLTSQRYQKMFVRRENPNARDVDDEEEKNMDKYLWMLNAVYIKEKLLKTTKPPTNTNTSTTTSTNNNQIDNKTNLNGTKTSNNNKQVINIIIIIRLNNNIPLFFFIKMLIREFNKGSNYSKYPN